MSMKLSAELFNEIISSLKSDGTCSRGHERRCEARVGLRCAIEIVPCTFLANKARPLTIHVHDISLHGLGLVSTVRLEEGSEFVARLLRDGKPLVPALYEVKRLHRLSEVLFSIGAKFQRVLPDADGDLFELGVKKIDKPRAMAKSLPDKADLII
jgi:hypothetical protein